VFATRFFRRGVIVLTFHGPLMAREEIEDFTHTIQVESDRFIGASGGLDDFVNHSCDPNCVLGDARSGPRLVALRDIAPGEEVSFDYSTCILAEPEIARCMCGAARCRGEIASFWRLQSSTRRRYLQLNAVPEFILESRPEQVITRRRKAAGY